MYVCVSDSTGRIRNFRLCSKYNNKRNYFAFHCLAQPFVEHTRTHTHTEAFHQLLHLLSFSSLLPHSVHKRFRELRPDLVPRQMTEGQASSVKVPRECIEKMPELRENPFRRRICEYNKQRTTTTTTNRQQQPATTISSFTFISSQNKNIFFFWFCFALSLSLPTLVNAQLRPLPRPLGRRSLLTRWPGQFIL